MSRDCVRGYGPEEYLLRKPMAGTYVIFANYYGSSEQTVIGPVTVTATVFTDYGQPGERRQVLTFRLDKPKQAMVEIGSIEVKGGK